MTANLTNDTRKVNSPLWMGIVLVAIGLLAIALPRVATIVTETWIALILISSGTTKLFYAFQTREQGGFIWKLLLGTLYIATGIMLFVNPFTGVLTLTLLLGSFLLAEGVFELILAFRIRPQRNWTSVLANGIVTVLLGVIVWFQWPSNAPWLLGTAVGASVIFTGISRVMLAINSGSTPNNPDQPAAV